MARWINAGDFVGNFQADFFLKKRFMKNIVCADR
jgi:hypothetical protein